MEMMFSPTSTSSYSWSVNRIKSVHWVCLFAKRRPLISLLRVFSFEMSYDTCIHCNTLLPLHTTKSHSPDLSFK